MNGGDAPCLCRADRFVAPTPERVHRSTPTLTSNWTGSLSDAGFVIPRQTFVPRCHGGNFPCRAVKDEELAIRMRVPITVLLSIFIVAELQVICLILSAMSAQKRCTRWLDGIAALASALK